MESSSKLQSTENYSSRSSRSEGTHAKILKRITASEDSLQDIHEKIRLHLTDEKPLTKFEVCKLLFILKRMEYPTKELEIIAKSAQETLTECLYSQVSDPEKKQCGYNNESPALFESPISYTSVQSLNQTLKNEIYPKSDYPSIDKSVSSNHSQSNLLKNSKEIFQDNPMIPPNCQKSETVLSNSEITNSGMGFLRQNLLCDSSQSDPKWISHFTVPSLLEKKNAASIFSQDADVIKLRFDDVQFDDNSISIPLQLLTNLNFRTSEEMNDSKRGYTQVTNIDSFSNTLNKVNKLGTLNNEIREYCHDKSLSNWNIEGSRNSQNNFKPVKKLDADIQTPTTSFGTSLDPAMSNYNWSNELNKYNSKLFIPNNEKNNQEIVKFPQQYISVTQRNMKFNSPKILHTKKENGECKEILKKSVSLIENAMDICNSIVEEQNAQNVFENKIRFSDKPPTEAIKESNVETIDLVFNNANSEYKNLSQRDDDDEEGSFEFNLNNDCGLGESPLDNMQSSVFQNKSSFNPSKHRTGVTTSTRTSGIDVGSIFNPLIISETPDLIIDETPSVGTNTSKIVGKSPKTQSNVKFSENDCGTISFYKKSQTSQSNSFLNLYKSYCDRTSQTNPIGNSNGIFGINSESETICQRQYFSQYAPKVDKSSNTQSENLLLIDGKIQNSIIANYGGNITLENQEAVKADENCKLTEQTDKLLKYRQKWQKIPVTKRVTMKNVEKLGLNIFENPVTSLLNLDFDVDEVDYLFPRLTLCQINERLAKSFEKARTLNRALVKGIDDQIRVKKENYRFDSKSHVSSRQKKKKEYHSYSTRIKMNETNRSKHKDKNKSKMLCVKD